MFIREGFFEFSFGIKEIVVVAQTKEFLVASLQNMYLFLEWWWRRSLKASELFCRWKIHEACMLALGSVKSIITDSVKNGRIHFDMHGFLTNVVLADLNLSGMCDPGNNCWVPGPGSLWWITQVDVCMRYWEMHLIHVKKKIKNLVNSHLLPVLVSICGAVLSAGSHCWLDAWACRAGWEIAVLMSCVCSWESHQQCFRIPAAPCHPICFMLRLTRCSTWIQIMLLAKWDSVIGNSAGFCSLCYLTSMCKKIRGIVGSQTSKVFAN